MDAKTLIITSTVRSFVQVGAGALVASGAVAAANQAKVEEIVTGIVVWAFTLGWSWVEKHIHTAKLTGGK
jgi:hypothetical protein